MVKGGESEGTGWWDEMGRDGRGGGKEKTR